MLENIEIGAQITWDSKTGPIVAVSENSNTAIAMAGRPGGQSDYKFHEVAVEAVESAYLPEGIPAPEDSLDAQAIAPVVQGRAVWILSKTDVPPTVVEAVGKIDPSERAEPITKASIVAMRSEESEDFGYPDLIDSAAAQIAEDFVAAKD